MAGAEEPGSAAPEPAAEAAYRRVQRQLTEHLRDPEGRPPPPGLDPERLRIYTEGVYRNIERLLRDNFPVLRRYLDEPRWEALVRDFLRRHRSEERRFARYPLQFLEFLESRQSLLDELPFMLELAHFEWLETDVGADPTEVRLEGVDAQGDLLAAAPVVNPVHRRVRYGHAVHLLAAADEPQWPEARECELICFRNLRLRFDCVELNAVTARLFALIAEDPAATGREQLTRIAWELRHADPDAVIAGGLDILERMRRRHLILGTRER